MKIMNKRTNETLEVKQFLEKLKSFENDGESLLLSANNDITLVGICNRETSEIEEEYIVFDIDEIKTKVNLDKDTIELGKLIGLVSVNINLGHKCDLCTTEDEEILFGCSVPTHGHSWGLVCRDCLRDHGCTLGVGKGQRLIDAE